MQLRHFSMLGLLCTNVQKSPINEGRLSARFGLHTPFSEKFGADCVLVVSAARPLEEQTRGC